MESWDLLGRKSIKLEPSPHTSFSLSVVQTTVIRVQNPPTMQETWVYTEDSPGGRNSNLLQYSCLENSMDGGIWQATVWGAMKELGTTERAQARSVSSATTEEMRRSSVVCRSSLHNQLQHLRSSLHSHT